MMKKMKTMKLEMETMELEMETMELEMETMELEMEMKSESHCLASFALSRCTLRVRKSFEADCE